MIIIIIIHFYLTEKLHISSKQIQLFWSFPLIPLKWYERKSAWKHPVHNQRLNILAGINEGIGR